MMRNFLYFFLLLSINIAARNSDDDEYELRERVSLKNTCSNIFIANNPFDKASDELKETAQFQRDRWFYEQRMYPNNFIDNEAYRRAELQYVQMLQRDQVHNLAGVWVNIGPKPQVSRSYGITAGRINTVKYAPGNPNIIYAGAGNGGLWKSTDGGLTWLPKLDNEITLSVGAIAIDPNNINIIYVGSGDLTTNGPVFRTGRGILKSTDGGDTWTRYTTGLPPETRFTRLLVRPASSNVLFAACGPAGGLFRSEDGGVTWVNVFSGRCDDIVFASNGILAYAIGSGIGLKRSIDGGNTFSTVPGLIAGNVRNHIALSNSSPNLVYAVTNGDGKTKVFKSTDAGVSFNMTSEIITQWDLSWYVLSIYTNHFDPNYVYVGNLFLWRSTDGGIRFQRVDRGSTIDTFNVHSDFQNFAFHPTDQNQMIAAGDGGMWRSTDKGTKWINMNSTLTTTEFYQIQSSPLVPGLVGGAAQDNGVLKTTGGNLQWKEIISGDGAAICFQSQSAGKVILEVVNSETHLSLDSGNTYGPPMQGISGDQIWIAPVVSHPTAPNIFYTARNKVFVCSTDTWNVLSSTGLTGVVQALAVSKSDPNVIYAAIANKIYYSVNGGNSFSDITSDPLPDRYITSVHVHPDSSKVVLLTYSGTGTPKVFRGKEFFGGTFVWDSRSSNLPDIPVNDGMFYYPGHSTNTLITATDMGVYITTNYGANWSVLGTGLPAGVVSFSLDYSLLDHKLRVGTKGRGVWEIPDSNVIISTINGIPEELTLNQNYPNPFNPVTNISYGIVKSGTVKLEVFDISGKLISVLVNEKQEAGIYNIRYNMEGLASGVYFYKLSIGNFSESRKMILVK